MPVTYRLLKDKRSQKYDNNITILCVLVDKTKYEEGISSQILAHNRQCRDLVPICVQAEKVVYIWSPSSPPSLLATFIPLFHSFGAFPLCNPTKTSQHYSVSAKDFQKLLGIHMLSQATLLFPQPSSKYCPSFTGGLLAGCGICLGGQWAHSNLWCLWGLPQGVLLCSGFSSQHKVFLEAGWRSHRHGTSVHLGAWEQPADRHQNLAPLPQLPSYLLISWVSGYSWPHDLAAAIKWPGADIIPDLTEVGYVQLQIKLFATQCT